MESFLTPDKQQASTTKNIKETDYTKKQLYNACMGLILNNKDGDIKSYEDLKNPQICYYRDGTKYLHFNSRVGGEYSVRIEGACDTFEELLADLENSKKEKNRQYHRQIISIHRIMKYQHSKNLFRHHQL